MSRVASGELEDNPSQNNQIGHVGNKAYLTVDPRPASRPVALAGDGIAGDGTLGDGMPEDDAEACAPANLTCCCRVRGVLLEVPGRR
jgi:hypothetical protein